MVLGNVCFRGNSGHVGDASPSLLMTRTRHQSRLVCRESSIVKGDGGRFMTRPRRDWKPAGASEVRPRMSLVLVDFPYPDSCLGTSPHQQGWDTKMEKLSYGGIDV